MKTLLIILVPLVLGGLFYWLALPRLRPQPWWCALTAHLWALLGNSKTIAVALAIEALALLDELKLLDWSSLFGTENGGRVAMVIAALMIPLRLVTRNAVSFVPVEAPAQAREPKQTNE